MQQLQPLVSILMTAYNREILIKEAIESVLACTYINYELILVDDCSTDKTFEVIQQYAANNDRIRYYQNHINLGDYSNRNMAASYAKGEYITYLDSDDKMLQGGLEKCIKAMQQFPDAGISMYWKYSTGKAFSMTGKDSIQQHFFKQPLLTIGPGGTVLKRSFFEMLRGYPEKYGPANDMYFNLKAACFSDVVFLPFEFIYYRQHESQESKNQYSYLYNNYLFLKDALTELKLPLTSKEKRWITNKNRRRFLVNLWRYYIRTKNYKHILYAINKTNYGIGDLFYALFN